MHAWHGIEEVEDLMRVTSGLVRLALNPCGLSGIG
jgi:hypothetical protein